MTVQTVLSTSQNDSVAKHWRLREFSLCFYLRWRYNRELYGYSGIKLSQMNPSTNRLCALLALASLTLILSYCVQKGGLTRPESSALTASNFITGK